MAGRRRSGCPGGLSPGAIQLIEGHANPLLLPPYDVAGPVHIVGLDDQFESVGNIERAEYFKRSPDRRQASYGAADGPPPRNPIAAAFRIRRRDALRCSSIAAA